LTRARLATIVVLALLAVAPVSAASFELGAQRVVEAALAPGQATTLAMPLVVSQDGALYVKLLATPGNAVNDGTRANGSVEDETGWRIGFALLREDGAREDLGTFVDSTPTRLVAVAAGEHLVLESTLHLPDDAARGGPSQRAYVALAHRAGASGESAASGATMDASRAITLVLSDALLPPAIADAPPLAGSDPSEDEARLPDVGPVAPIEAPPPSSSAQAGTVTVALPVWFLGGVLALLGALVGLAALQGLHTRALMRELRARMGGPRVSDESARAHAIDMRGPDAHASATQQTRE